MYSTVTVCHEIKIPMEPREHRQLENVAISCVIQGLNLNGLQLLLSGCVFEVLIVSQSEKNWVVMYTSLYRKILYVRKKKQRKDGKETIKFCA